VRVGRESRSYYLIGYNPGPIRHDGRFRKLDVRLRRKGLTVRARRGYYAPSDEPAQAERANGADPELQKALDAPGTLDGIPLQLTAYVLRDSGQRAQVVLAAEADLAKVAFVESEGRALASLDTLLVVSHRETGDVQRRDQAVQLERRAAAPGGAIPYAFLRELELPAGTHQAKLIVRDVAGKRVGSVLLEFDVPPLDRLRVSTPILSDTLQRTREGGLGPATAVRRVFPAGGSLYCAFDVFAAARGKDGRPQVTAGHALRRVDGTVVGTMAPNAIQPTSIGALTRIIQIPLAGTAPGDYELVLDVRDEITGEARQVVESFSITAPAAAAAAR
jgi:hypothetical protein